MPSPRTARRMARLVAQWRQSGESQAGFARRHHIPPWTFWYWCRKLEGADQRAPAPRVAPTFVPVDLAPPSNAPMMEVVFQRQITCRDWTELKWLERSRLHPLSRNCIRRTVAYVAMLCTRGLLVSVQGAATAVTGCEREASWPTDMELYGKLSGLAVSAR